MGEIKFEIGNDIAFEQVHEWMSAMSFSLGQRVRIVAHIAVDRVVVSDDISRITAQRYRVPRFPNNVVLDQVLGVPKLQENCIGQPAGVTESIVYVIVRDLAPVNVRQ